MNLQQMIDAINRRVDDVVDVSDAVEWLNSGKNQMAAAIGATFPDLVATDLSSSFAFDSKYHEAPVLYASASFKEQDSALGEAQNFMYKFDQVKNEFVRNYEVPPSFKDGYTVQQFVASGGKKTFTITKESYSPSYGDLKVYVNNIKTTNFTINGSEFTCLYVVDNDKITAMWEEHTDLIEPPYNWWGSW